MQCAASIRRFGIKRKRKFSRRGAEAQRMKENEIGTWGMSNLEKNLLCASAPLREKGMRTVTTPHY